jgi:DNA-binding transcriptional regulator YiaG
MVTDMATEKQIDAETICGLMDHYGPRQLALILNVSVDDLYRWSSGESRPPAELFFRVINLTNAVTA